MFEVSFSQASKLYSFFLFGFCPPKVDPVVCVSFVEDEICAELCFLFLFPLMGKTEWGGNPDCWWLGLYFCFVCCLNEASCTGCDWWLGDARSCIHMVSFEWVLTIWSTLILLPGKSHGWRSLVGVLRVRVAKSQTRLNDFTFTFYFHALEKEMATHSSVLAWRIPGTEELGGLLSMESHRVGHDWCNLAAAVARFVLW